MSEPTVSKTAETVPTTPPSVTLTFEQMQQLIEAAARGGKGGEAVTPDAIAKAFAQTQRRENPDAPMVSVYNPRGERDHPRPQLRAKTTQNGIRLREDSLTWEEIEMLNALPAGEYRVSKANGMKIPMTVKLVKGFDEAQIEAVEVHYPCKDEHRHDHRSLLDYGLEYLTLAGKDADVERISALKRELDRERQQIAS